MPDRVLVETKFLRCIDRDGWFFVERPNASGVVTLVPVTDDGRLVLIEQYRPPVKRNVIELPAGLVGDEHELETLEAAAHRELREETGYDAGRMSLLATCATSPGVTNEESNFFLATKLTKVGTGGGVQGEEIRVHEVALTDVRSWLAQREATGILVSMPVFVGVLFAQAFAAGGATHW